MDDDDVQLQARQMISCLGKRYTSPSFFLHPPRNVVDRKSQRPQFEDKTERSLMMTPQSSVKFGERGESIESSQDASVRYSENKVSPKCLESARQNALHSSSVHPMSCQLEDNYMHRRQKQLSKQDGLMDTR